ncbi:aldehyde dehydrogenase family protein, partial [Shinella sp.]|uniref:aldehyde dehydrogenase family protein n=1 Tax=Shinella sp. TaxID=1870904 RepID=UPI0039E29666
MVEFCTAALTLSAQKIGEAIALAGGAFQSWRETSPRSRAAILRDWAALVRAAANDLAVLVTAE